MPVMMSAICVATDASCAYSGVPASTPNTIPDGAHAGTETSLPANLLLVHYAANIRIGDALHKCRRAGSFGGDGTGWGATASGNSPLCADRVAEAISFPAR